MIICTIAVLHKGDLFRVFAMEGEDHETAFANVMCEDDVRDGILQFYFGDDDNASQYTEAEVETLGNYFSPFNTVEWEEAERILTAHGFEIRRFYNLL